MRVGHFMTNIWEGGGVASYIARVGGLQQQDGHELFYFDYEEFRQPTNHSRPPIHYVADEQALFRTAIEMGLDLLHTHTRVPGLDRVPVPCVRMVHGHQPYCPSGSRFLARWSKPCDRAYSITGCTWGHLVDRCGSIRPQNLIDDFRRTRQEMRSLRDAWVITPSEFVRQQMIRSGYEASRVFSFNLPVPEVAQVVPPPNEGTPRMLFMGRIVRSKGIHSLVLAMQHVQSPVHLDVAGSGPDEAAIANLVQQLGLKDKITLHGWMNPDAITDLLRRSRALIFPSIWHEPGGTAAFEAMMQSRPVICSRVGGMPEVVIDHETGLLYPPGDERALAAAIDRLAADGDLAQKLGAEGRRQAMEKYTLRKHVDHVMGVYARCRQEFASRASRVALPLARSAEQGVG